MTPSALLGPLLHAVAAQTPVPTPEPEHTIYTVTPGIGGFITFFVLAFIGWLLFRSMHKHVRKVDQEELRRERRAAEEADRAAPEAEVAGDESGEVPRG